MLLGRKLLYHRGIDDSMGTYVTDYVLFVECLLFFSYYVYLFVKHRETQMIKHGHAKSTYAMAALFAFVGVAAVVGGLAHQFLQTVEPYDDWRDNVTWAILWRMAAALSGAVSFVFLLLIEHLLTSEGILNFNRTSLIVYYVISVLACCSITGHSFWVLTTDDPWTLLVTFAFVFLTALVELIVGGVVVWKRYRSCPRDTDVVSSQLSTDTLCLSSDSVKKMNEHKGETELIKVVKSLNNNKSFVTTRRHDLLLHFLATLSFFVGGAFQTILARFFGCSDGSQDCPFPSEFNHNAIFHVVQMISMVMFFVAELIAISTRRRLQENMRDLFGKPV